VDRACSSHGVMRSGYRILVEKSEWKRSLGRPRHRWQLNFKMDLREIWCEVWSGFIWLRIGTDEGLLWTRWWTSSFHKRWGICWLPARSMTFTKKDSAACIYLEKRTDRHLSPDRTFCATNSQTPVTCFQNNGRVDTNTERYWLETWEFSLTFCINLLSNR
jgi:hypothetical protein